jgi:3D-(3,5/4)-trihydroxycyclohexane-1,2-dione acylhydrolase (decyclizing)
MGGVSLIADARRGLEALSKSLKKQAGTSGVYRKEVAKHKAHWDNIVSDLRTPRPKKKELAQAEVIGIVNEAVGGKASMICAAGSMPGDLLKLWRPSDPKAYHVEYGFSCMGYEIPAAIGIKLAEPGREVVVMIGDGTYLMMNSEIVTAVAEGLDFTIVVVDNKGYGSIRGLQMSTGSPSFNNELRRRNRKSGRTDGPTVPVDFAKHAEAMGSKTWQVKTYGELSAALAKAKSTKGVKTIVVPVSLNDRPPGFESWWDSPMAQVSTQAGVKKARKFYDSQAKKQRKVF